MSVADTGLQSLPGVRLTLFVCVNSNDLRFNLPTRGIIFTHLKSWCVLKVTSDDNLKLFIYSSKGYSFACTFIMMLYNDIIFDKKYYNEWACKIILLEWNSANC